MSWTLSNADRTLIAGTSLTQLLVATGNWQGRPGSLTDQIRATPIPSAAPNAPFLYVPSRMGQTAPALYSALAAKGRRQTIMAYGVSGRTAAGLQGDLAASIYVWKPQLVIVEITTNDLSGGTNVTPGGAFQLSYNGILDGIGANLPGTKVLALSVTGQTEVTTAGPNMSGGSNSWAGNLRIQESCAARSSYCEYVDVITPFMNFCVQYNLPFPGGSSPRYLTVDSLHCSDVGARIIANAVMQHLVLV